MVAGPQLTMCRSFLTEAEVDHFRLTDSSTKGGYARRAFLVLLLLPLLPTNIDTLRLGEELRHLVGQGPDTTFPRGENQHRVRDPLSRVSSAADAGEPRNDIHFEASGI